MTDPRAILDQIQRRANAATEGPWAPWLDQDGAEHMGGLLMVGNAAAVIPDGEEWVDGVDVNPIAHTYTPEDRAFIAAARTDVPALVDALRAVLELHVRAECPTCGSRDGEGNEFHKCDDDAYCEECDLEGYPCPTVTAVTAALAGVEGEG